MSEFKTFSAKTVDEAIEEACKNYGVKREKLEIELISGGSSGIFGLVGKKKAQVRARLREEVNLRQEAAAKSQAPAETRPRPAAETAARPEPAPRPERPAKPEPDGPARAEPEAKPERAPRPEPEARPETAAKAEPEAKPERPAKPEPRPERPAPAPRPERAPRADAAPREERRQTPAPESGPIPPELEAMVREIMEHMLNGILGLVPEFEISGQVDRVSVLILDEENSGLLIGREGQTLAALQYLVNRMVIRRFGAPLKVQINTGEYRERQDDNLRKMAVYLADKAKTLGRPQSTKPLSSYHRRVVHLALQEDDSVQTRSKGEGPLKRVLIVPKAAKAEDGNGARS